MIRKRKTPKNLIRMKASVKGRSMRPIAVKRKAHVLAVKHSTVISYLYDTELSEIDIMIESAKRLAHKI